MTKPYTPKGKIVPLLERMREDPARSWGRMDVARVLACSPNGVIAMLTYALRARVIHRGIVDGVAVFRVDPYPGQDIPPPPRIPGAQSRVRSKTEAQWTTTEDDLRVPKVIPGWRPPQMVAPRG